MTIRLRNISRGSLLHYQPIHPNFIIPPNDPQFYAAAVAGSSLTPGFTYTLLRAGFGGASSIAVNIISATGYAGGDTITLQFIGADENYTPIRELVTLTNPAIYAQTVQTFSRIDSVTVISQTGLTTETLSIGIGDDSATPQIRMPHPLPGYPATSVRFQTLAASPVIINPTAIAGEGGRYVVVDLAAATVASTVAILFLSVNDKDLDHSRYPR